MNHEILYSVQQSSVSNRELDMENDASTIIQSTSSWSSRINSLNYNH